MTTLVAALIAATAALLVTVVERVWVARDERKRLERADKRQVYARFLGASTEAWLMEHLTRINPESAHGRMERYVVAEAELNLVGSDRVREAAGNLMNVVTNQEADRSVRAPTFSEKTQAFITAARRDLRYRS